MELTAAHFPDAQHVEAVRRALWADRAAVMVGAGMSRNAEPRRAGGAAMPVWSDLARLLIDRLYPPGEAHDRHREALRGQASATSATLRLAEEFAVAFGRPALDDLILAATPDGEFAPGPLHRSLLELPWADVLTTNYDTLLERAAAEGLGQRYSVVRCPEEIPGATRPRIVKLHGSLPSNRPFVLTEEDFRTYPRRFAPFVNLAQQAILENAVCLLGFSGDDPNFLYWTGWVRDHLGGHAPNVSLCGLLELSGSQRLLLNARNVTPIDLAPLFPRDRHPDAGARHREALGWLLRTLHDGRPYSPLEWPTPREARPPASDARQSRAGRRTDATNATTRFAYAVGGDRDTVTDARGNVTQMVKDGFGRAAGTINPFGKITAYAYDRDGRLLSVTDRLGRKRAFAYDAVDQKTSEKWSNPGSTAVVQRQSFVYTAAGDLAGATDPDGSYALAYDALRRPLTVAGPFGLTLTFGYDAAGHRIAAADNRGGAQASAFDALGRLASRSLDTAAADAWVDFGYTVRDKLAAVTRSSDLAGATPAGATVYAHDPSDRLTGVTHAKPGGAALAAYAYAYDAAGRPTSRTEGGVTRVYAYNDRDEVTADAGASFGYDARGNRTNAGYATPAVGNRLASDGVWAYTYDDEGQVTKRTKGAAAETWAYGYDHRGQVAWAERRAADGGPLQARVEYSYDAFGNRVKRVERNGALAVVSDERYAFDGWDTAKPAGAAGTENFDAWADLSSANAVTTRRLFGAGVDGPLARVPARGRRRGTSPTGRGRCGWWWIVRA